MVDPVQRALRRRRAALGWGLLALLLVGGFFAAIGAVARDVHSPAGVVQGYLDALARHDARSALAIEGVLPPGVEGGQGLLTGRALGRIDGIRIVDDAELEPGLHRVTAAFRLAGRDAAGPGTEELRRDFLLRRGERSWLFFDRWGFAESPLETVRIAVEHDRRFTANDQPVVNPAIDAGEEADYLVFSPGLYRIDLETEYLRGEAVELVVAGAGGRVALGLEPTPAFAERIDAEVAAHLEACATQRVLQPSGCPFGRFLTDRLTDEPEWRIVAPPSFAVISAEDGWRTRTAKGVAHLRVGLQAIFDGSRTVYDQDVPFEVSYRIDFAADGSLTLTER